MCKSTLGIIRIYNFKGEIDLIKKRALFLLIAALILLISIPSFADGDLVISKWIVESRLLENGDLVVTEDLTFDFRSKFNGVYRYLVTDNTDGIENLKVYEIIDRKENPYSLVGSAENGDSGVYLVISENNNLTIKIFSPARSNTLKTFRFKYIVKNVAVKHIDTGELYYKFIGRENSTTVEYFSATIELPDKNKEKTKIFAHGPLNGEIYFIEDNLIKMEVSNVQPKTFVEARILFPENFIGESCKNGNSTFNMILDEERSYIERIEEKNKIKNRNKNLFQQLSLYATFAGIVIFSFITRTLRRKPKIFDNIDLNPEDISPAELRAFMNSNVLDGRALMTTILDLSRKGYLTIEEIEPKKKKYKDFRFSRIDKPISGLLSHEVYILNWLFNTIGDESTVTTIDIDEYRKKHFDKFNRDFNQWIKEVKINLKNRGYYDSKPKLGILVILISIVIFIVGIIALIYESLIGLIPLLFFIFLFLYGILLFSRKSDKGYVQYKLWKKIRNDFMNQRNILNDFDFIPKDKTLIYALALGLPMKSMEKFRSYIPSSYSTSHWTYYYFLTNKYGGSIFEDRLNSSFYGSSGTTTSSSFGGGGGFSSGGGSGAGGGGAGGF